MRDFVRDSKAEPMTAGFAPQFGGVSAPRGLRTRVHANVQTTVLTREHQRLMTAAVHREIGLGQVEVAGGEQ
jgi:hypothetical protein